MVAKLLSEKESLPQDNAHLHVEGQSEYIDDMPLSLGEVHVGLVYSPHAKAKIISIDTSKALAKKEVVFVGLAKDLKHNCFGSIFADQPYLAESTVNHVGEPVAIVAAETRDGLKDALDLVKVEYEVLPPILSIKDALKEKSYIGNQKQIIKGDTQEALKNAPHILSGSLILNGADHFYLENQSALAYPKKDGILEVYSSTQHPTETQMMVAEALGLSQSSVICITPRLGGGFGGKETQAAPFAVYASLVAHHTKRPARLILSKDDDMIITGKRNPYEIHYTVGFNEYGEILGLECQFYADGGAYADLSTSILERAMLHVDNAYFLPSATIKGHVLRTNFHSHTAFRGFGGPKGIGAIEHIIEEIGQFLKIDALTIRKRNCYKKDRDTTPYGQRVENNKLEELFDTLEEKCDYRLRRKELEEWNSHSLHNPKGMALTAVKFGIAFTTRFLNQGHALIHIFRDGSLQVATGAVEMGQGVATRIKTIVSDCFGIFSNNVRILPTASDKTANTSPTAASSGTDLNGAAALDACIKLKARLAQLFLCLKDLDFEKWPQNSGPFATEKEIEVSEISDERVVFSNGFVFLASAPNQKIRFVDLVNAAYFSRISLSAYGFYKVKNLQFNKLLGQGQAFNYFTQGVACSEVEIDRFSGAVKVLRADILMDLGNPINDALDRGQITGGFIQGVGWMLTEKLFYNEKGFLVSHSPSTYKIPSIHDIPRVFNIDLIKNDDNKVNLYSSKASGEPPLMLCFSVLNAVKNALAYKNPDKRLVALSVPATAELILKELDEH